MARTDSEGWERQGNSRRPRLDRRRINAAEMDRIVRPPGFDERGDLSRLVSARSPIAGERDADLAAVAAQRINAIVSVRAVIGLERMPPTDSKPPIFAHPFPEPARREGGEGWISQAPGGLRPRPWPMRLGVLLLIGDEGRAGQAAKILKVFARVMLRSLAGPARRRVLSLARMPFDPAVSRPPPRCPCLPGPWRRRARTPSPRPKSCRRARPEFERAP